MRIQHPILTHKSIRWFILILILALFLLGGLERIENITIDLRYHLIQTAPQDEIVLVLIDSSSIKQLEQWPWPRRYYGDVIRLLDEGGARIIGLDLDFSSHSSVSEDRAIVRAVEKAGNVVLGVFYENRFVAENVKVQSSSLPFDELGRSAAGIGSLLFPVDSDGSIRKANLKDRIQGKTILSFAGELARQYLNLSQEDIDLTNPTQIRIRGRSVHLQSDGSHYIGFIGKEHQFQSVSFAEVLAKKVDPSIFQDKIVLIGASAIELRDIWKTPYGLTPGVSIQASALQSLLSGNAIYRLPPWIIIIVILIVFFFLELSLTGSFKSQDTNVIRQFFKFTVVALVLATLFCIASVAFFMRANILLDTVPVLMLFLSHYLWSSFSFNWVSGQSVKAKSLSLLTLHSVGELSIKERSLEYPLELLSGTLRDLMGIEIVALERYDSKERAFTGSASHGLELGKNGHTRTADCDRWMKKAMTEGVSIIVPNLQKIYDDASLFRRPIRSSAFIPLLTLTGVQGILHVHSSKMRSIEEDDLKFLATLGHQLAMNIENVGLIKEANRLFYSSIGAFSSALELRDNETEGHSKRVSEFAILVGQEMRLNPDQLEILRQGALLHDIGKIGVPDAILRKPGKLNGSEVQVIQRHSEYGYRMLRNIDFPEEVAIILLHHHEQYDGSGYPSGLSGDQISIYSRIFTVVDTYDAMRSTRPYRKGVSHEEAIDEISSCSGSQFDPNVVNHFLRVPRGRLKEVRTEVNHLIQSRGFQAIFSPVRDPNAFPK